MIADCPTTSPAEKDAVMTALKEKGKANRSRQERKIWIPVPLGDAMEANVPGALSHHVGDVV